MPDIKLAQPMNMFFMLRQLGRFGMVGLLAAAVHYVLALLAVGWLGLSVALANLLAFLWAFWVSFFGHHYFTFNVDEPASVKGAGRFFMVAALGFMLNESIVVGLTHFKLLPLSLALVLAIVLTAAFTFLLNRQFAFKAALR